MMLPLHLRVEREAEVESQLAPGEHGGPRAGAGPHVSGGGPGCRQAGTCALPPHLAAAGSSSERPMRGGVKQRPVSEKQVRSCLWPQTGEGLCSRRTRPARGAQDRKLGPSEAWVQVFSLQIVFRSGSVPQREAF